MSKNILIVESDNDKYFDKFWLNVYFRYDCCKVNESNADINCRGEIAMKKENTFNFNHECLNDLKTFLYQFN